MPAERVMNEAKEPSRDLNEDVGLDSGWSSGIGHGALATC